VHAATPRVDRRSRACARSTAPVPESSGSGGGGASPTNGRTARTVTEPYVLARIQAIRPRAAGSGSSSSSTTTCGRSSGVYSVARTTRSSCSPTRNRGAMARRSQHDVNPLPVRSVAEYLGNTAAVARTSYVDPLLIDLYDDGATVLPALERAAGQADDESPYRARGAPPALVCPAADSDNSGSGLDQPGRSSRALPMTSARVARAVR
jgi:hypothetical protein